MDGSHLRVLAHSSVSAGSLHSQHSRSKVLSAHRHIQASLDSAERGRNSDLVSSSFNQKSTFDKNHRSGDYFTSNKRHNPGSSISVPSQGNQDHMPKLSSYERIDGIEAASGNIHVTAIGEVQIANDSFGGQSNSVLNGLNSNIVNLHIKEEKNTPIGGVRKFSSLRTARRQTHGTPKPDSLIRAKLDKQALESQPALVGNDLMPQAHQDAMLI